MSSSGFAVSANRRFTRLCRLLGLHRIASGVVVLLCSLALFVSLGTAQVQERPSGMSGQKEAGGQLLNSLQAKQLDQAISLGRQAVARWPQNANFHHWLGIAYFQSGRNAEALEQLGQAATLRPGDYDIHFDTALVHLQEQQYAAAAEQLQKALRSRPDQPLAHLLLGRACQNTNRSLEAIEQFKTALRLKPDIELGHYHLGYAYASLGRDQEAIAEYKKEAKMKDAAGEYASGQIDILQKHLDTAKSLKSGK